MKINYCDFLPLFHLLMPRAVEPVAGWWAACQDAALCWCQSARTGVNLVTGLCVQPRTQYTLQLSLRPAVDGEAPFSACVLLGPSCPGERGSGFQVLRGWDVHEVRRWSWGRGSCSWFAEEASLLRSSNLLSFCLFSLLLPWTLFLLVATVPPALDGSVFPYTLRVVIL